MGKNNYTGGHTVVGPESGWFTQRRILEDEAEDASRQREARWQKQVADAQLATKEDIEGLHARQQEARRHQEARKAKIRAKREARKSGTLAKPQGERSRKNMDRWLGRKDPDLAREVRRLFDDK